MIKTVLPSQYDEVIKKRDLGKDETMILISGETFTKKQGWNGPVGSKLSYGGKGKITSKPNLSNLP